MYLIHYKRLAGFFAFYLNAGAFLLSVQGQGELLREWSWGGSLTSSYLFSQIRRGDEVFVTGSETQNGPGGPTTFLHFWTSEGRSWDTQVPLTVNFIANGPLIISGVLRNYDANDFGKLRVAINEEM